MFQAYEHQNTTEVIFEKNISQTDIERFEALLSKNFSLEVHFKKLFFVPVELVMLLDTLTCNERYAIKIFAHTTKVYSYFLHLGFHVHHIYDEHIYQKTVPKITTVLIGGSADSTDKIVTLVKNISLHNTTLVIVQHLPQDQTLLFDALLQTFTDTPVSYAKEHETPQKGHIYLAPPCYHLLIKNNAFTLSDEANYNHAKPSISLSYESFSNAYKEHLLIIQECGFCADGVDKLQIAIKNKTTVILQDSEECNAKEMLSSAYESGFYHYNLKLDTIIGFIQLLDNSFTNETQALLCLVTVIKKNYEYDFTHYRKDMLSRRVASFLDKHALESIQHLILLVQINPYIFKELFLSLSINVTEFFREAKVLQAFTNIIQNDCKKQRNIKLWDAGCSCGQEAYSLAILLATCNRLHNSIIYATDFNATVIEEAKNGCYAKQEIEKGKTNSIEICKENQFDKSFTKHHNFYKIKEELKNRLFFFTHNLIKEDSFNEFDIIFCRNVIIYFDIVEQEKVFTLFYNSLRFGGFLILGEKEFVLPTFSTKFTKISQSIYRKTD